MSTLARVPPSTVIRAGLRGSGYAHLSAADARVLTDTTESEWAEFARHWDHLEIDQHMADGGTYRRRRYSQMDLDTSIGALTLRPHGPYRQPRGINPLNGGVDRHFEPCTDGFLSSPVLTNLLSALGASFTEVSGATRWVVRLHPYRITATPGEAGEPAPEGLHRDGVTYIMTLMIRRTNVVGGESSIHDTDGARLYQTTLACLGELLLADDAATLHGVTALTPLDDTAGHRDVLVIAFTDARHD